MLLLVAHLVSTGPLLATLAGVETHTGIFLAAGLTAIAVLPGGMRSVTWTQMIQFIVAVVAYLAPAAFLLVLTDGPASGEAARGDSLELSLQQLASAFPFREFTDVALLLFITAAGAASLSPVVACSLAARTGRQAGSSLAWALLIGLILVAGLLVLSEVISNQAVAARSASLAADPLILAIPIFAALPAVLAGLVITGLLAASFATGQSALLSAANALSRNMADQLVEPGAEGRRIFIARLLVVAIAAGAGWISLRQALGPLELIGWSLAVSAAANFVPLLLGMWWRKCTASAAVAGMCASFGIVALTFSLGLVPNENGPPLMGIDPIKAAAIAMPTSLLVTVATTLIGNQRIRRLAGRFAPRSLERTGQPV
jgi:cation/acetate symporter